jgi:hypothetical protein
VRPTPGASLSDPRTVEHDAPARELELLIREARRRQRRRRVAVGLGVTAAIGITIGLGIRPGSTRSAPAARPSVGRRPSLGPNGRCPTSSATFVSNKVFDATVFGRGLVRLAIGNRYDKASQAPGSGPLSIPAEGDNTGFGFRVYPGSVWVRSSGCYAVQISGRGFNESIVFDGRQPIR